MPNDASPGLGHNTGTPRPFVTVDLDALRDALGDRYAAQLVRVAELEKGRAAVVEKFGASGFTDDETAGRGGDWITRQVRPLLTELDEARTREKQSPLDAGRLIDGFFKRGMDQLTQAVADVRAASTKWINEKDRRAKAEQARIAREAEEEARKLAAKAEVSNDPATLAAAIAAEQAAMDQAAAPPAPVQTRGDHGSVTSARMTWDFELVDIAKVPKQYLLLNETLVRTAIRTAPKKDGIPDIAIPGVRIVGTNKATFR